jgi:hypothetical protein
LHTALYSHLTARAIRVSPRFVVGISVRAYDFHLTKPAA